MGIISGGGGGGYTPPTGLATYLDLVSVGAFTELPFTYFGGPALLNVTAPTAPTIVTAGIYALTARFGMVTGVQAGKTANLLLALGDVTGQIDKDLGAAGGEVNDVMTLVGYCAAGAALSAQAAQDIGSNKNLNFKTFLQRIT